MNKKQMSAAFKRYWLLFSIMFISFLFVLTLVYYFYMQRITYNELIKRDVADLAQILKKIDTDAGILDFEHNKNYIDFLNVVKFVGSEVGPMNLKNPKGWQGPYLLDNPTMQEQYYQVIKHNGKYYIAPGDGVKLSSGKKIGTDMHLDKDSDFKTLLSEGLIVPLDLTPPNYTFQLADVQG